MAFAFEKIDGGTELELRKKIPKSQPILSFLYAQVIDRDRDIVYLSLGGRGNLPPERGAPPDYHALIWKGLCILFEGYEKFEPRGNRGDLNIRITLWRLPAALRVELAAIHQAIRASIIVYRMSIQPHLTSVLVHLPEATYY